MPTRTRTADWLDQASAGIDLRQKLPESRADTIARRAEWLDDPDRTLLITMFRDGCPATEIARLTGEDARRVRRRVRRAVTRALDPALPMVVTNASSWSATRRRVAHALFRSGLSIRETARRLGLTIHEVLRHRDAIRERVGAADRAPGRAPDRAWRS